MVDLSDDEQTVLSIAAHGEYMAPIGRWSEPIKSLHAKGLMHRHDDFNYVITDAGRKVQQVEEQSRDDAMTQAFQRVGAATNTLVAAQKDIHTLVESAATSMAEVARLSSAATGEPVNEELKKWTLVLAKRALELVQ